MLLAPAIGGQVLNDRMTAHQPQFVHGGENVTPAPSLVDSGWVQNSVPGSGVQRVFEGVVRSDGAMWVRIRFDLIELSGEIGDADASYLLLTSEADGAVQQLYAQHVAQWALRSAYFNGDAIRVELFAAPGTGRSRVRVHSLEVGEPGFLDRSLCGSTDDRVLDYAPAAARMLPGYCTAWLVNNRPYGLVSAGHCVPPEGSVVQFNVPLSTIGGSMRHPPPEDQYPVDPDSIQTQQGAVAPGNDWLYFGVFANCNTGLSPLAAQGMSYETATTVPPVDGRQVRTGGYGTVILPVPLLYNYVYKSDVGPLVGVVGNNVRYQSDTTSGDSGSAVIDQTTGLAIAIHTNGGCNTNGFNRGTATKHADFRAALVSPRGMCAQTDGVRITFPRLRPAEVSRSGGTVIRADFAASATRSPVIDTAILHVFDGNAWLDVPMAAVGGSVAMAAFPAVTTCAERVRYYISVENSVGEVDVAPRGAPGHTYEARVAQPGVVHFASDFAEAEAWESPDASGLLTGMWKSSLVSGGSRGTPRTDFDGTGNRAQTGPEAGEDVDGGPAALISPWIDLSDAVNPVLSFAAWYTDTNLQPGTLAVEVLTDLNPAWQSVDAIAPTDGWEMRVYRLADFISSAARLRVRFVASDEPNAGIVEAAVDRFRIDESGCTPCMGDLNSDGHVDVSDLQRVLRALGDESDSTADLNADGRVDSADLLLLVGVLGGGCP
ncbi:MAG: hypothetical protein Kow0022_03030 [Phycisphaerales bacterium]